MEHPRPWLPASVMLSFCSGVSWSLSWLLTLFTVFIVPDTTESGFSWPSWGWPGTGATGDHVTGSDLLTFTGITPPLITFSTNFVLLRMRATASLCVAKERGTPHILTIWSPGWRPWLQSNERILGLANIFQMMDHSLVDEWYWWQVRLKYTFLLYGNPLKNSVQNSAWRCASLPTSTSLT